jgi:hypothetical protein
VTERRVGVTISSRRDLLIGYSGIMLATLLAALDQMLRTASEKQSLTQTPILDTVGR